MKKTAKGIPSNNEWRRIKYRFREIDQYVDTLDIKNDSQFYEILHALIWHEGIDPLRWIHENKILVEELIDYSMSDKRPSALTEAISESIKKQTSRSQLRKMI